MPVRLKSFKVNFKICYTIPTDKASVKSRKVLTFSESSIYGIRLSTDNHFQ